MMQMEVSGMNNLAEYIRFRGDLLKTEREFTAVDYAVLADMSYLEMKSVYDETEKSDFRTLFNALRERDEVRIKKVAVNDECINTMTAAAESDRFGLVKVCDHIDIYTEEEQTQFSVVTWEFDEDSACVMFRGTDDTVAGWKEDFIASYMINRSQIMAVEYVEQALKKYKRLTVGGHSKGGNLALYAAVVIPKENRRNLEHVWLFDSPGLCEEMADPEILNDLDEIVTFINPAESIVGRIFEYPFTDHRIVESSSFSLLAHEMGTWKLDYLKFLEAENYSAASEFMAERIRRMTVNVPIEDRPEVVERMFARLDHGKVHSLTELKELFMTESKAGQAVTAVREKAEELEEKYGQAAAAVKEKAGILEERANQAVDAVKERAEEFEERAGQAVESVREHTEKLMEHLPSFIKHENEKADELGKDGTVFLI